MNWLRKFRVLGLTLALLAGVSCSTGDGPTGLPAAEPIEQPSQLLGTLLGGLGDVVGGTTDLVGGVVRGILDLTGLLSCEEQRYDVTWQTIGTNGGTIRVGNHYLVIPRGALNRQVRIKAEQMRGPTNSVRFSPEGLEFEKPAALILSYENCLNVGTPKSVVYTTEQLEILEVLRSWDLLKRRTITAPIDHFSRYAVAY